LLHSVEERNQILQQLQAKGLGGSAMYDSELTKVAGVRPLLSDCPELPNASSFASRFLTLPVHESVSAKDLDLMVKIVLSN
jgi:dTDP-4-amino-4,6-dideoxygalactose transaminase